MCNCVAEIDAKLKEGGHCLNTAMYFDGRPSKPLISLVRLDRYTLETRMQKPRTFLPSFCPFCGEKYAEAEASS